MTHRLSDEADPHEPDTAIEPVEPGWSREAFFSSLLR